MGHFRKIQRVLFNDWLQYEHRSNDWRNFRASNVLFLTPVSPQSVVLLFSVMYNMFVDEDGLSTIHDVAGRLAASAVSSAEWASTELGSFVDFTDEHSRVLSHPGRGMLDGGTHVTAQSSVHYIAVACAVAVSNDGIICLHHFVWRTRREKNSVWENEPKQISLRVHNENPNS